MPTMKNLDRIMTKIAALEERIVKGEQTAATLRTDGHALAADFAEIDRHYDEEELAQLRARVSEIEARAAQILAFESETGVEFDASAMDLPDGDLIAWWYSVRESHPEHIRTWTGAEPEPLP